MIDLDFISSPPHSLRALELRGSLRELPQWIKQLENLVKIQLYNSKLEDDPLEALQNMQNLLQLQMYDAYIGEQLNFKEGLFPKLKLLRLGQLSKLKLSEIEKGALNCLENFHIGPLPRLKKVPSGLQHLRNLESINFLTCLENFFWSKIFSVFNMYHESDLV